MSKRLDPKDLAIQFVMTQPLEAATTFVETLAGIVKARARQAAAMNSARSEQRKAADTTAPARSSRSRAPLRDVKLTDPNAASGEVSPPATSTVAEPPRVS